MDKEKKAIEPCDNTISREEDEEIKMLNVLSLFSGIGAFEKALSNLNIPYNLLAYCEIDKYASKSYSAIHGVSEELNLQDVTKVDSLDILDDVDFITYGFPCQDISNAGKQRGFTDEEGNRTRSGLFFEALRIIEECQPKFAIAENVKALTSKKFTEEFKTVLESLEEAGYNNYWQVLNAKDYGVPQNRERVFIVSIRKDIDKGFTFPKPIPLELRLKDLLEDKVDEKYYLSEKMLEKLTYSMEIKNMEYIGTYQYGKFDKFMQGKSRFIENKRISDCLQTRQKEGVVLNNNSNIRIRKLTPTECYKLQGFTVEDCKKASEAGVSNSQLYKQAGNSICVSVLEAIYKSLGEYYEEFKPLS